MRFYRCSSSLHSDAASLLAGSNVEERVSLLECKMNKVRGDTVYPCRMELVLLRAGLSRRAMTLCISSMFLYWKFYPGGNDYAVKMQRGAAALFSAGWRNVDYEWELGYRIGASYRLFRFLGFDGFFYADYIGRRHEESAPVGGKFDPVFPYEFQWCDGQCERRS